MIRFSLRAGALALAAGLLLCGCAPAPSSSSSPSSVPSSSDSSGPASIPLPDPLPQPVEPTGEELAALTHTIEEQFRGDWDRPGRYLSGRLDNVRVIPPEEWADLNLPLTDGNSTLGGKSWMNCIAEPGGCILMAQTTAEYFPETILCGPQYSDGVSTHVYLALKEEDGWTLPSKWPYYQSSELPEPSPDPVQEQLDLTRDQWLMLQHQMRALALSGIFRDLGDPLADLTAAECAWYLYARADDWGGLTDEGRTVASSSTIFQADFAAENASWAADWRGGGPYMPVALQGPEEVFPAQNPNQEQIRAALDTDPNAIVYQRTGDAVTATLTLPLGSDTVTMEYLFGLVTDQTGPVSRTYLKSARRL